MDALRASDLHHLVAWLRALYVARDHDGFVAHLVSSLPALVGADMVAYNEVDTRRRTLHVVTDPNPPEELQRAFERHMHEHPLLNHYRCTGDGSAVKFSDFLSRPQYHRLALYNECYRWLDAEYQMSLIPRAAPPVVTGIALNRRVKDFSERDRLLLTLLQPHVQQALANAEVFSAVQHDLASLREAVEATGQGVAVLVYTQGRDRVQWCSARVRQWLLTYFGPARPAEALPDALARWVAQQRSLAAADGVRPAHHPWTVVRAGTRLSVRWVATEERQFLLFEEHIESSSLDLSRAALASLGLTRRETEILALVAQGQRNREIAAHLCISPRTVKKHLEHMYHKLGVTSRTQASARALEVYTRVPTRESG